MDAYGRPSSAEILEELALVRAQRLNILRSKNASESANGRQDVKIGTAHLETLFKHEQNLLAQLSEALIREGHPNPTATGIIQIFPMG